MSFIPKTYEEWEECITVKCGIPLTREYVAERLVALQDSRDIGTQQFIDRWGKAHHARTLSWFREAEQKLGA